MNIHKTLSNKQPNTIPQVTSKMVDRVLCTFSTILTKT